MAEDVPPLSNLPQSAEKSPALAMLSPMTTGLTADISASAVVNNINTLRDRLGDGVKLCAVIKADCYGHGMRLLLPTLAQHVDHLAVATGEEALQIRRLGCELPLLVFTAISAFSACPAGRRMLAELVRKGITLTAASPQEAHDAATAAAEVNADALVHVKIDSGMGRSGVLPQGAPEVVAAIRKQARVKLMGIYTHFASSDEADKSSTREQLAAFLAAVDASGGREGLVLHAANSGAAIDLPETHLDMVRCGIVLYGCQPSDEMHQRLPLQPALRLWGRLTQVKSVPAGSKCGYGLTHQFERPSQVGLVPIGYADGYLRCLSNKAVMRVCGKYAPVRGRVSMDQVILDLTDIPQARIGDMVEIMSDHPEEPHSVENLARLAETISYEIACRLGSRIHRVLVK